MILPGQFNCFERTFFRVIFVLRAPMFSREKSTPSLWDNRRESPLITKLAELDIDEPLTFVYGVIVHTFDILSQEWPFQPVCEKSPDDIIGRGSRLRAVSQSLCNG